MARQRNTPITKMTSTDINLFFKENPHLRIGEIIKESGISKGTFAALKQGKFSISKENEEKLNKVFSKYRLKP